MIHPTFRRLLVPLVSLVAFAWTVPLARAAAGLDPSFGESGTTRIAQRPVRVLAQQSGGQIITAGWVNTTTSAGASTSTFGVMRLENDGSADPSFGGGGSYDHPLPVGPMWSQADVWALHVDSADRVLVAATVLVGGDGMHGIIVRLLPDGTLDGTFGTAGVASVDFVGDEPLPLSLLTQPDGKIVVGGNTRPFPTPDLFVARLLDDGTADGTFGTAGATRIDALHLEVIRLFPDSGILAAGYVGNDVLLARFDTSGALDPAFGTGGVVSTAFPGVAGAVAADAVVEPDGSIVVAANVVPVVPISGYRGEGYQWQLGLARYADDGTLDASFGTAGLATFSFYDGVSARRLLRRADGRLLVVGQVLTTVTPVPDFPGCDVVPSWPVCFRVLSDIALIQVDTTGMLDPSFGVGGLLTSHFAAEDYLGSAVLTADERVLTGWGLVARYCLDGCSGGVPCRAADKSSVQLKAGLQPALRWTWRQAGAASVSDFGDPLGSTGYAFEVVDSRLGQPLPVDVRTIPSQDECGTTSCWKATAQGYKFRVAGGGGLQVGLRASAGQSSISFARGGLGLDAPPLPLTEPVTIRLRRTDSPGICWEATFATSQRNDEQRFSARLP